MSSTNPFAEEDDSVSPGASVKSMATADGQRKYEPAPRLGHATACVDQKVYLWAGWQKGLPSEHSSPEKTRLTSVVDVFDLQTGEWKQYSTTGSPPLGVRGYTCATVGKSIYYFGGWCGHDWCRHNTVHRLDTETMMWHDVKTANPHRAPMKKNSCGMVAFKEGEDDLLFVCNGAGLLCSAAQAEALYIPWKDNPDYGWTNEMHLFSISDGSWSRPEVTGEIPPPCAGFTLTKISETKALFHGGFNPETGLCLPDVYVAELSKDTVHWYKLAHPPTAKEKLPRKRNDHTVVCIASPMTGSSSATVFMLGGRDHKWAPCNDCWVLDCYSGTWTKVLLPDSAVQRHFHSMSAFHVNQECVWVVSFGGVVEWLAGKTADEQPIVANTTVIELCKHDKQWTVGSVIDSDSITCTDQYKNRLISKLLDSQSTPRQSRKAATENGENGGVDDAYVKELQQEIETISAGLTEVTHRARLAESKATSAEKKKTEALEQAEVSQLAVKETRQALAQSKVEIEALQKEVTSLKAQLAGVTTRTQRAEQLALQVTKDALQPYLVSKDEIEISSQEIDDGTFGRVVVAQFRGLRVAAKCLKQTAQSEFQKMSFAREMYAAIHVRHPNLQQFIAASLEGEIVVLTELMSRNIRKELQKGPFPHNYVCSIAEDIASVLSYLHQNKPEPIIYQDVSSDTVLLESMGKSGWKAKLMENGSMSYMRYASPPSAEANCYVAPEVANSAIVTPKADTYSFGILLIEMATRKLPPIDPALRKKSIQEIKWANIASLVQSCISSNLEERPTMAEVCDKLQNM